MRYRWVVLAIGTFAQGVFAGILVAVPVLSPALQDRFNLSLSDVGLLIFAAVGAQALTQYAWGLANDRFGERVVLPLGLGSAGGALVLAGVAGSYAAFVLALVAATALAVATSAASGRAIMGWFDERRRGLALGIRQTSVTMGSAVAAFALPFAAAHGGIATAFSALAVCCGVAALAAAVGLREPPLEPAGAARLTLEPIRDRRMWRLIAGSTMLVSVQGVATGFVVLFLHGERGLSAGAAAAALAVSNLAASVVRLLLGYLSDRLGKRLALILRLTIVMALAAAGTAAAMEAPNYVLVPALVLVTTLALSWNALLVTVTVEIAGRARTGAALGLQQTVLGLAFAGVAPVFAQLVRATSWQTAFALVAILPLAAHQLYRPLVKGGIA